MNTRLVKRCELQVFNLDRNPVLWRRSYLAINLGLQESPRSAKNNIKIIKSCLNFDQKWNPFS